MKQRIQGRTCKDRREYAMATQKLLPLLGIFCNLSKVLIVRANRNRIDNRKFLKFRKTIKVLTLLTITKIVAFHFPTLQIIPPKNRQVLTFEGFSDSFWNDLIGLQRPDARHIFLALRVP